MQIKGWYAQVRVDGTPYQILGGGITPAITAANQTAVVITPTRTSFLLNAGPIIVNMTFLSPIEVCISVICDAIIPSSLEF